MAVELPAEAEDTADSKKWLFSRGHYELKTG